MHDYIYFIYLVVILKPPPRYGNLKPIKLHDHYNNGIIKIVCHEKGGVWVDRANEMRYGRRWDVGRAKWFHIIYSHAICTM